MGGREGGGDSCCFDLLLSQCSRCISTGREPWAGPQPKQAPLQPILTRNKENYSQEAKEGDLIPKEPLPWLSSFLLGLGCVVEEHLAFCTERL